MIRLKCINVVLDSKRQFCAPFFGAIANAGLGGQHSYNYFLKITGKLDAIIILSTKIL